MSIRDGGLECLCAITFSTDSLSEMCVLRHLDNPKKTKVTKITASAKMAAHSKFVSCTDWVRGNTHAPSFVTSSMDKKVLLWSLESVKSGVVSSVIP